MGAGYAGLLAALRVARRCKDADVTLIDLRSTFVERVRLHQLAAGQSFPTRAYRDLVQGTGVAFAQGRVRRVDLDARIVDTDRGALPYHRLVLALGSTTDLRTRGARQCALALETESTPAVLAALAPRSRVAVVGGGLAAIETVTELAEARPELRVLLVSRSPVGHTLSRRGQRFLAGVLARLGVEVREGVAIDAVEAGRLVRAGARDAIAFDACVWTAGFLATGVAREAGLDVNDGGQATVDESLRSVSHPEVFAVGDAASPVVTVGAAALMSCRIGMPMALHAADNLARELHGAALAPFRIADVGRGISLGRSNALVQLHRSSGEVREAILTGRLAAWVKERIVRSTIARLDRERWQARRAFAASGRRAAAGRLPA